LEKLEGKRKKEKGKSEVGSERLEAGEEGRGEKLEARIEIRGKRSEASENDASFVWQSKIRNLKSKISSPASDLSPLTSTLRAVVLARDGRGYAELSRLVTQRCLAESPAFDPSELDDEGPVANRSHHRNSSIQHSTFNIQHLHSAIHNPPSAISDGWTPDPTICFSPGPHFEGSLLDSLLALSAEHVWILTDSPALLRLLAGRRNVFAELILTPRRRGACRRLYDLAHELHVPVVATADVHFARREDYPLYRLLHAIATQKTVETLDDDEAEAGGGMREARREVRGERRENGGWRMADGGMEIKVGPVAGLSYSQFNIQHSKFKIVRAVDDEHYFKTEGEMAQMFRGLRSALRNTRYIAEHCNVDWASHEPPLLGGWKFPRVTLPSGETAFSYLWKVTFDGLKQRYRPLTPDATRRLEYELEIIARLGFCEYFLAVNEIAEAARQQGRHFLGRGSAANSIVSFALGLTPVDPIRHNLYFERFLNPERRSPPDIDLDFSWKERDVVVRWIFDHFGYDRVALISTHITLQPRQAIREVGKAMGVAEAEVNRFTRPIPGWVGEARRLAELPEVFPECRHLPVGEEPWKTILAYAERLLDFPRHLSIHCGGLLITPEPITDYTPLQRAAKGPIITQMEMHAIEDLGLIKMDILGNRSLGVLSDCLEMLVVGGGK